MAAAMANYEQHAELYYTFSPYNHLTADDPPLMMVYSDPMTLPSTDSGHAIHHPVYGVKMKEKSDQLGHELHLVIEDGPSNSKYQSINEFLIAKLLGEE